MRRIPEPVKVRYVVKEHLFAQANIPPPKEPVELDLHFTATPPLQAIANNPLLASFNPVFGERLGQLAEHLFPYQEQVMEYVRESQANAESFIEDPLGVLVKVCKIPQSLQDEIKEIQKEWPPAGEEL